jgi:hypothetical protein
MPGPFFSAEEMIPDVKNKTATAKADIAGQVLRLVIFCTGGL